MTAIDGLTVPRDIMDALVADAESVAPIEACGILSGRGGVVEKYFPMTNVDNSADHFMMAPEEQFAAVKAIRAAGQEMLAVFHSHAETPARPSEEDIRLGLTPGVVHAILSLCGDAPVLKSFGIDGEHVTETPVHVREPQE